MSFRRSHLARCTSPPVKDGEMQREQVSFPGTPTATISRHELGGPEYSSSMRPEKPLPYSPLHSPKPPIESTQTTTSSPPRPPRLLPQKRQRNRPHLTLTASLHPSTLSLSSPALLTTPITLTLSILLSNSDSPITVYANDCFLSTPSQDFYQSDYRLRSLSTGTLCTANVIYKHRLSLIRVQDPEAALLELKPGEVVTREVRIGVAKEPVSSSSLQSQLGSNDDNNDSPPPLNLSNLAICATPLSELTAGEEYEVELTHGTGSGWPNHVWWWNECGKEEVIREAGKRGPDGMGKVNIRGKDVWALRLMSGIMNVVTVEMGQGAVLKVVE